MRTFFTGDTILFPIFSLLFTILILYYGGTSQLKTPIGLLQACLTCEGVLPLKLLNNIEHAAVVVQLLYCREVIFTPSWLQSEASLYSRTCLERPPFLKDH